MEMCLFFTLPETESLGTECQHGQMRALFPDANFSFSLHVVERKSTLSGSSSVKALIPFLKALSFWSHHLLRRHLLVPSPLGLGFQHMNWGEGDTNIETIAMGEGRNISLYPHDGRILKHKNERDFDTCKKTQVNLRIIVVKTDRLKKCTNSLIPFL